MSSEVRSYLVGSKTGCSSCSREVSESTSVSELEDMVGELVCDVPDDEEVAMTKNVVRSKRMTSVALHASANVDRCLDRMLALGISVWTILDHAYNHECQSKENEGAAQCRGTHFV